MQAPRSILQPLYDALEVKHTGHWLAKMGDMFKKLREVLRAHRMFVSACIGHAVAASAVQRTGPCCLRWQDRRVQVECIG